MPQKKAQKKDSFTVKNRVFSSKAQTALTKITSSTGFEDMNLSFALSKLRSAYENALKAFNFERQKTIEQYCVKKNGKPDLNNGNYMFDNENGQKFNTALDELFGLESTIEFRRLKIKISDVPKKLLSPDDIYILGNLIDFEE